MKLSIIMPVYNEEKTIREIIRQVINSNPKLKDKELIIVDDGSKDSTREILKKEYLNKKSSSIKVIFHEKNQGKGAAIITGIKHVTGDIVVIQDADLEYDPNEYTKLIEPIINGQAKVVYGSRFPLKSKKPAITNPFYLANRILTITTNALYNAKITDEPTCYKIFDSNVLKSINLKCKRFEFCPEVTAKVRKKGYKIYELSISYNPRTVNEGKKIKWKDGVEAFWTLIKYRFVD